jgi:cellulose synthase/poly-beta-1,6-N-acetylglucosamine synthase-like glycosyltransferase
MVRSLININDDILKILLEKKLISNSQLTYIYLIVTVSKSKMLDLIVNSNILSNELLIQVLNQYYNIKKPKISTDSLKNFDYSKVDYFLKRGYFIYCCDNGKYNAVVNDLKYIPEIMKIKYLSEIYLFGIKDFQCFFEHNFHHLNLIKSKYSLNFISPKLTAKNINYIKAVFGFAIVFFTTLIGFANIFHIANNIGYFTQNLLKVNMFRKALKTKNRFLKTPTNIILPIYTVLIPLYKEDDKLDAIIEFIDNFNYPKHKLDVKIIIEADDYSLIDKIRHSRIPFDIQIIEVPYSLPRTKPKALNYALQYCRGKYVVIYDAEDKPHPNQLLNAVCAFNSLSNKYACMQAKLNFYNADENLLTKFFSIEYSLWFDYLLKGLSLSDLPVTLGGTSNHFKINVLKEIGGWDAYNVTEDADLGIRMYSHGYKVHVIDSYTYEEAPISIGNWLNQSSRWIKGFMQTFFVFLKLNRSKSKLNNRQILSIYVFVGISTYSFCCLPWILLMVVKNSNPIINYLWLFNSFFAFSYVYATAYHILLKS